MAITGTPILTNAGKSLCATQMAETTQTPPKFIAIGTGATNDPVVTAIALTTEYGGAARATGTVTVINGSDTFAATYQAVGVITAAGAVAINEAGLFTALTGGTMAVVVAFPVINLASGDQITITSQIRYT